jgi:hypothetical protein
LQRPDVAAAYEEVLAAYVWGLGTLACQVDTLLHKDKEGVACIEEAELQVKIVQGFRLNENVDLLRSALN